MGKAREKQAKTRENRQKQAKNRRKTGAFLVLVFLGEKLVGANFYAFCNYAQEIHTTLRCFLKILRRQETFSAAAGRDAREKFKLCTGAHAETKIYRN